MNFFWENGYLHIKSFFDKQKILSVKKDIDFVFANYCDLEFSDKLIFDLFQKDFESFHGCAKLCQNLISLAALQCDENIINLLKNIGLRSPVINTRPLLSISSPYTSSKDIYWKVPSHQDWPSMQGSLNGITCWIPLVNIDKEIGSLQILPKSHLFGCLEHQDCGVPFIKDDFENWISVEMEVGDILLFNTLTIHKSGVNIKEDAIRWSAHFRYDDFQENSFIKRKYPRHRIDKRKEGILYPNFPNENEMRFYIDSFNI